MKCQQWADPEKKIECTGDAKWRPVMILYAPVGDVGLPIKLDLSLCDLHKSFDWRAFMTYKADPEKPSFFEAMSQSLSKVGKARPDLERTQLRWESCAKPFMSEPPGSDA